MFDDEIDDDYQNKTKRKALERKKYKRRFCSSCTDGCRNCPKLKNR